ncbi:GNAT family N-acetyltransferase [Paenibacillus sp. FSL H7-0326]|uniref:GNAT family N-acetyltransferase n=1 Tax=Paenibacillus sp. FSL H7-0326 TaxID=1921144 RepID=UPI00096C0964|nr:GNAT family N-acetyltransferase [Paenibacillus sp. FSL H7-0326]OMC69111.1 GNAT family N-acetyltransferase [Paenibacillus sp. FSL H7-0326]
MYSKVSTQQELEIFYDIKRTSWNEKGFEMEYVEANSEPYIFYIDGNPGGTFQFTPYNYSRPFMRNMFDEFIKEGMKIVEVDSFAVLPDYRGRLGREIVSFMIDYANTNQYTHAVGMADPSIFRSFNNTYHIRTTQVKEKVWFKGAEAIPALFHLKEAYERLQENQYDWYIPPEKWKAGVF